MIQELREYSKTIFFKILLGVIAITFVLSFGVGGFFGDRKEVIANINSNEILLKEYREAYQNRLRALQQQFGENVDQIAEQINLRKQVFDQLVDRYLLLNDTENLNLIVTDLELQEFIKKQPFFQNNGQFDYRTYEAVLNQNRIVRHEYENSLRKDILLKKKREFLISGIIVNDEEVEQAFRRNFEKIELDYVFFDPQAFMEETETNKNEAIDYYQKNKNKFKSLNKFKIEYFTISSEYFKERIKIKEREVRRYYKKNIENYVTPPQVKARHILLKVVPNATEKLVKEKQEKLQRLLSKINSGESFEELAKSHSEDGSSSDGGDLGWFKPGEMVPAFEEAAFSLDIGQVSQIVRSPFGLHLIKVDDLKEKITKSLEDVRNEILVILTNKKTQKRLKEETERLISIPGDSFFNEAKKLNKDLVETEWFDSLSVIPKLGSVSSLVSELMRSKLGEIGVWKRNPVMGYVFYKLNDTKGPEIKLFEDSKDDVYSALQLEKAQSIAIETAKKYFTKLEEGALLEELSNKHGLTVETIELTPNSKFIPKIGNNREFLKVGLKLNNSEKFGLSISGDDSHLIQFKKRKIQDKNVVQLKEKIRSELLQILQQAVFSKELKRLRDSAEIEIKNTMFLNQESS